jgi:hypothetical protein
MSDIPSFRDPLLWEGRVGRSVANLARKDGGDPLALAPRVPVRTEAGTFALEAAGAPPPCSSWARAGYGRQDAPRQAE